MGLEIGLQDNPIQKKLKIVDLAREFLHIYGNRSRVYKYTVLSIIGSIVEAVSLPLISLYLLFAINPESTLKYTNLFEQHTNIKLTIINFSIFIIVFVFCKNIYLYLVDKYIAKVNIDMYTSVTTRLMNGYLKAKFSLTSNIASSKFINLVVNETNSTIINIFNALINIIKDAFVILFIIGFLLYADITSTVIIFLYFILLFYLIKITILNKLNYYGEERVRYANLRMNNIFNIIDNNKIIKLYHKQEFFSYKFKELQEKFSFFAIYPSLYKKIPRYILEFFIFAILPLAFILSELTDNISKQYVVLVLIAATRLLPSFNRVISSLNEIETFRKSLEDILVMQKKLDYATEPESRGSNHYEMISDGQLKLDNVCFSFNNQFKISEISLSVPFGNIVAFVGPSGGGKTTLINLIMNFYSPEKGSIAYANHGLSHLIEHNQISYVSQNLTILNDTLANNIAFGCKSNEIDFDRIQEVLKIAHLGDFVSTLPNGLNHILQNGDGNISGGQKQRLALARALYSNPKVLILDEFTSSLDVHTENSIMNVIYEIKSDMIVLIIAHRLNTIKRVDSICYIEDGKILECGNYNTLLKMRGKFYDLVNL